MRLVASSILMSRTFFLLTATMTVLAGTGVGCLLCWATATALVDRAQGDPSILQVTVAVTLMMFFIVACGWVVTWQLSALARARDNLHATWLLKKDSST